jgi:hypothetical protein
MLLRAALRRHALIISTYLIALRNAFIFPMYGRVHEYNHTANGQTADIRAPPLVLAALSDEAAWIAGYGTLNRSFTHLLPGQGAVTGGGITISLKGRTAQSAIVSICRFFRQTESSCQDGIDNDW